MKIKAAEKNVTKFGGNYSYFTFLDCEFVDYYTGRNALFPDDMKEMCKKMKKEGFKYQYLALSKTGIKLCFYRSR